MDSVSNHSHLPELVIVTKFRGCSLLRLRSPWYYGATKGLPTTGSIFYGLLYHIISLMIKAGCGFILAVCWLFGFNLCGPCVASVITLLSWLLQLRWGVSFLQWFWLLGYLCSLPCQCFFLLKDIFLEDPFLPLYKALDDLLPPVSLETDLFDSVLSSWVRLSGGDYFSPPLDSSWFTQWNEISLPLLTNVSSRCIFGWHSWHL